MPTAVFPSLIADAPCNPAPLLRFDLPFAHDFRPFHTLSRARNHSVPRICFRTLSLPDMSIIATESPAAWTAADLQEDQRWIFVLDERARRDLTEALRKARDPDKTLFDYRRADFDLGSAAPV